MKKVICLLGIVGAGLWTPVWASPTSYSGSLSHADGSLVVGGQIWTFPGTTLSWVVTDNGSGQWHYQYTFNVPGGSIGCVIIEASPTFEDDNMLSVTSEPTSDHSVDTFLTANHPSMPASMYGIQFCLTIDPTMLVIDFDSDRDPVWGDFYANGYFSGGLLLNYAYNAGFLTPDPLVGPHNGSEQDHLLVPDTTSKVPVPGAILLAGLGAALVGQLRRRRVL